MQHVDLKQVLKLPEILDPSSPKVDNSKPGCFGGKYFHSPRNVVNGTRKDSNMSLVKDNKANLAKTIQTPGDSESTVQKQNGFNYMGLDLPSHMTINPEQAPILNVRYKGGKPVKRSLCGDRE
jgi:23S rRNA A2030 N6-methylase RlmJ